MITIDRSSRKAVLRIERMHKLTKSGVEFAAYTSAKGLQRATSAEILRRPKSGRVYIRRDRLGRRRRHVASAPGETHANMTGATRRSLSFKVSNREIEFGYGVQKGDAPEYAEALEFGRPGVAARPSLRIGIKGEVRNFQKNFDREIGKRLEGKGF